MSGKLSESCLAPESIRASRVSLHPPSPLAIFFTLRLDLPGRWKVDNSKVEKRVSLEDGPTSPANPDFDQSAPGPGDRG